MLTEAFQVQDLEAIPARIRSISRGASGQQTLVYVRHEPVTSAKVINPRTLKDYLAWWDTVFVPVLQSQQFALLGISFVVQSPSRFYRLMEREHVEDVDFRETVFRLLDEMEKIDRRDLLDFLRTHNIRLVITHRDETIEHILEKTGGDYEKTVEELENLVHQAWDVAEAGGETAEPLDEEFDY